MTLRAKHTERALSQWLSCSTRAHSSRRCASAVLQNLKSGKIVDASALSSNRWTGPLSEAVEEAGEIVIRFPWDKAVEGAQHAEQILLAWAKANGYIVLAVASAGRDICAEYCVPANEQASKLQDELYGVPIFYVAGGYW
jgi:hypothetical protein